MSDASVAAALRSQARLVVIEAPAGCGKTYQGAGYAYDLAPTLGHGRLLVLAHTHAACDVFATKARSASARIEIRTIDSLIAQIAAAYHTVLGLPADPSAWARRNPGIGYKQLAYKVAHLLDQAPMVAHAMTQRYPVVICDEHQDCSSDQHAVAMALHRAGAALRVFGDPMQRIFGGRADDAAAGAAQWSVLVKRADGCETLDTPHRWFPDSDKLGQWILAARETLRGGGKIDLRGALPAGLTVLVAENQAQRQDGYQVSTPDRKPIDAIVGARSPLLILAAHNATVNALRSFFNRRIPIWEGHTRDGLSALVAHIQQNKGDPTAIAQGMVKFLSEVAVGFSPTAFSSEFLKEIAAGCSARRRGKPATLQELGRYLLAQPDHHGVAAALHRLEALVRSNPAFFGSIHIDLRQEFHDAIRLREFEDCEEGLSEINRRRTHGRPSPPIRAISTVHKAKGLECDNVVLMPCDARHFRDADASRCLLYVGMSRAMRTLTLVVSRTNTCPLFII